MSHSAELSANGIEGVRASSEPVTLYTLVIGGSIDERLYESFAEKSTSAQLDIDHRLHDDPVDHIDLGEVLKKAVRCFDAGAATIDEHAMDEQWHTTLRQRIAQGAGRFRQLPAKKAALKLHTHKSDGTPPHAPRPHHPPQPAQPEDGGNCSVTSARRIEEMVAKPFVTLTVTIVTWFSVLFPKMKRPVPPPIFRLWMPNGPVFSEPRRFEVPVGSIKATTRNDTPRTA